MNIVNWLPRYYQSRQLLQDLPRGARVLDIACGEGDLSKFLADRGCKVWGADLSEADIRKGFPRNLGPNLAYVVADASALPFASKSVDWVVTFDTLDDLPDDTDALREFARVLKDGGILLLCGPVRAPIEGDLFWEQRALRKWLPKFLYAHRSPVTGHSWFESTYEDIVQYRMYPLQEVLKRLPQFEPLEYDYAVKRFSALAMDIAYGIRGFPRLGLKPYALWVGTRLDALLSRGPKHRGYTLLAKLRKKP
jgi:ubiquinone/menaquinone biosynthesis C-methylase UbiE